MALVFLFVRSVHHINLLTRGRCFVGINPCRFLSTILIQPEATLPVRAFVALLSSLDVCAFIVFARFVGSSSCRVVSWRRAPHPSYHIFIYAITQGTQYEPLRKHYSLLVLHRRTTRAFHSFNLSPKLNPRTSRGSGLEMVVCGDGYYTLNATLASCLGSARRATMQMRKSGYQIGKYINAVSWIPTGPQTNIRDDRPDINSYRQAIGAHSQGVLPRIASPTRLLDSLTVLADVWYVLHANRAIESATGSSFRACYAHRRANQLDYRH